VVNEICNTWLGRAGAVIAVIGVVACPVTSGDTAFRSARLTIADMLGLKQSSLSSRLYISIPIFIVGFILTFVLKDEFGRIWKFVGISNQSLATIVLWTAAMYMALKGKSHWFVSLPATFLTVVCITYLLVAPNRSAGLALPATTGYIAGISSGIAALALFLVTVKRKRGRV